MQGAVEDMDLEFDGVVGRERILHREFIFHRARDGLGFVRVTQAMESGAERHRIIGLCLHVPAQQRSLDKFTIYRFHVVNHHIIIMCVVEAERRQSVGIVEAQVTVAVGLGNGDDALAAESAVGIHQIGEAFISDMGFNGILHGLLASAHRQGHEE